MALTVKQRLFVQEYLLDMNASAAARRAGYSEKSAFRIGQENMQKPAIAGEIEAALAERSKRTRVTSDQVVRETARVAFFNPLTLLDQDGEWLPLKDWPKEASAAVKSIDFSTDEHGITRVRRVAFWDKTKGLELLGKHLKTWDGGAESSERDLIGSLLKSLAPTVGPPSLRNQHGSIEDKG